MASFSEAEYRHMDHAKSFTDSDQDLLLDENISKSSLSLALQNRLQRVLLCINIAVLMMLLSSLAWFGHHVFESYEGILHEEIGYNSMYCEFLTFSSGKVDMQPQVKVMNGSFRDNASIWRMPPSPEVDKAWDWVSAEDMQLVPVSAEDVLKSGKQTIISVQAPKAWGFGDNTYIAQIEVFHQIHCLNELRKEVHVDYYYGGRQRDELRTSHVGHCIHMLLQQLMCAADVGIITHYWLHDEDYADPKTRPFPDFSVEEKCRDFDGIMEWLRSVGGIKDLATKMPIFRPEGVPFSLHRGYTSAWT
ncbi:hypothetical protein LIA77_09816 [Sarocladium implicatum]|nr:hypothetical protein LIA77_09816 [Sarocladium implicatum]